VILDAPCSGTGTLRGHPEIKLRLRSEDLERLAHTQAAMLRAAARVVKPGGVLLYAVCSLTPEEGVEQVEALLRSEPAFEPLPVMGLAEALVPARVGAYLLPVGGLDGFYLARLARAG
jgi:16S rRNA (cytosine967-C5)-methyltransferase